MCTAMEKRVLDVICNNYSYLLVRWQVPDARSAGRILEPLIQALLLLPVTMYCMPVRGVETNNQALSAMNDSPIPDSNAATGTR